MLAERIEAKWIDAFTRTFELCRIRPGDVVAILSETLSRKVNVHLTELALLRLKARPFHVVMPTPPQEGSVPIRSTGCSVAIGENPAVVKALCSTVMVADCTVEGLQHSKETAEILGAGSRILYVSDENPEILERLQPDPADKPRVQRGVELVKNSKRMFVTSKAGTNLEINVEGARCGGGWGAVEGPGDRGHWPGGLVACYPQGGGVSGTLVLDTGDINLTFKRYNESPIRLTIEKDYITKVEGEGLDAELMRSYFAAWNDKNAYATAHLGWGMNRRARWDAMVMYDHGDHNGVEQRVFGGNFLFSTGANQFANRYTLGHFDLPMKGCTVALDKTVVVKDGQLQGEFA